MAHLGCCAAIEWASGEAHHMMFSFVPCTRATASTHWRDYRFAVVWNPIYWLMWGPAVLLIAVGRRFHGLFDQDGPVHGNDGESEVEHEVRVWWIFPSDAAFLGGIGLTVVNSIWYAADGALPERYHWSALLISVVIYATYVGSNIAFLASMRQRDALLTHCFIAGNCATGIGVSGLLVVTVYRIAAGHAQHSIVLAESGHAVLYVVGTWVLRVGFVLFLLLMALTYSRLWSAYDDASMTLLGPSCRGVGAAHAGNLGSNAQPTLAEDGKEGAAAATVSGALAIVADEEAHEAELKARARGRRRQRLRQRVVSLIAAFTTGVTVVGLLVAAAFLNSEGLWEALA